MEDTIVEYDTEEKERTVTEVVTDYETVEERIPILRCDRCERSLGPLEDLDPHAKVAVNPSVRNLRPKVKNPTEAIKSMDDGFSKKVTTMNLSNNDTVKIGSWTLDVMDHSFQKPTDRVGFGDPYVTYEIGGWNTNNAYHRSGHMYNKTESTLNLVLYEDAMESIWQADWDIEAANPEIDCDASLDLCETCAKDFGVSTENGNGILKVAEKEGYGEESSSPNYAKYMKYIAAIEAMIILAMWVFVIVPEFFIVQ